MPVVPRITNPQVQATGLPNARSRIETSEEAFGGGQSAANVTQAAQGAIGAAQRFAMEAKQQADDTRVKEALADIVRKKQHRTFDPKEGALARKGKNAFGIVEEYGSAFDQDADEIEATLGNETQKSMFRQLRTQQKLDFMNDLERHTMSESQKYEEEVHQKILSAARDEAILNYNDADKVAGNVKRQRDLIVDRGTRTGKDAQVIWQEIGEVTAQTHTGVIDRFLANGQDEKAMAYFQANNAAFGKNTAHVEKALEEGSIRGESQRQSDALIARSGSMAEALAGAEEIKDPKIRDAATDRVKAYYAAQKAADAERTERIMTSAGNIIDKTGSIDQIPPGQWATLSPSEKASLQTYAKHKREGTEPVTDWQMYHDLKTLASTPEGRSDFVTTSMMKYRGVMADAQFKELIDIQVSLRKNDGKAEAKLDGYRTNTGIVNDSLLAAGIRPNPREGTIGAEKVALFRSKVDEELRVLQHRTGKPATNEEVQSIVDSLLVKGTVKGSGIKFYPLFSFPRVWQTEKRAFQAGPGEELVIHPRDIPQSERSKIEEALRRRNIQPTEDKVLDLFKLKHLSMSDR